MAKAWIDRDEWYPAYSLDKDEHPYRTPVEVPDALWERYVKVEAEFDAMQSELAKLYMGRADAS